MSKNHPIRTLLSIIGILILAAVIYNIPFVNDKLSWRVDELRTKIIYFFRPPEEAVFVPQQETPVATRTLPPPQVRTPTLTSTVAPTDTGPTATPTITPTPLPATVTLPVSVYVDQTGGYNLCGPSNLTMALKFWKWKGTRDEILWAIKPGINDASLIFWKRGQTDKNVMPYELVDFVNDNTDLRALWRYGGSLDLIKSFIAAGYPMLIEKGEYQRDVNGIVSWMGHYQFITGYNDAAKVFTVQDTYIDGPNFKVAYAKLANEWRAFDYVFMVIYPAERETQVQSLLGPWADAKWANQHALETANQETKTLSGLDAYFAWFNKGTSHVQLLEYQDAASAYDQAFLMYPNLPLEKGQLPYRMMWYQTGPYKAYFYSARYQDVIDLANVTLKTLSDPTLEESLYWRGMAEQAAGNAAAAVDDFKQANHLNPKMVAIIQALQSVGIAPEKPVH
jgi:tetratricopeptide (TPR) repeat protein